MIKIINPCRMEIYKGSPKYQVFCTIEFNGGKLSIIGVHSPCVNGDCRSAGQLVGELSTSNIVLNRGWDEEMYSKFISVWEKWHLNHLRAECKHQEEKGLNWTNAPGDVCSVCGWKLGHGWSRREVPKEVVEFLKSLPSADEALLEKYWGIFWEDEED